jgi:hypothetical protein
VIRGAGYARKCEDVATMLGSEINLTNEKHFTFRTGIAINVVSGEGSP